MGSEAKRKSQKLFPFVKLTVYADIRFTLIFGSDDRRGGYNDRGGYGDDRRGGYGRDRHDDGYGDDRRGGGGYGRDRYDDRRGGGGYDDRDGGENLLRISENPNFVGFSDLQK